MNRRFAFLGFEELIPKSLPDHVFWIIGVNHREEYIKNAAQLNEDLAFGIPFKIPDFENNVTRNVKWRGIISAMSVYEFPKTKTEEFIALNSLKEQLKITIKSGKSESLICGKYLLEAIDASIPSVFERIVDDTKKIEIREGKADIHGLISKINEEIKGKFDKDGRVLLKGKSGEIEEKLQSDLKHLTIEVKNIWRDGRLDETLHRIKATTDWVDFQREKIEKNLVEESEIEDFKKKTITKYGELKKKWIGIHIFTNIDRLSAEVLSLLSQLEEKIRKKVEQSYKLAFLSEAEKHLTDSLNKINVLNKKLEDFYQREVVPPPEEFVQVPGLTDLIDSSYQLPALDIEEIKKQWIETKEKKIEEKVRKSFKVNLLSIRLADPHEGWLPVDEHINKPESKIAITPDFAQVKEEEHFDYSIKRSNYWKVVVYHFIFNVSMREFLKAFKRKWLISEEER